MKYFEIFTIIFFLSSCSTSKSIKQINLIDKNIDNIQQEVKEVKNSIKKTQQAIDKIKQEQPSCNIETIESQIVFLEYYTNTINDNLSFVKQDLGKTKFMIDVEIKEYRGKYHRCVVYVVVLIVLLFWIVFNRIKIDISGIVGYVKNIYNWFKKI